MDTKDLMSGIAVVIDDALVGGPDDAGDANGGEDLISQIVGWFETEWDVPSSSGGRCHKRPFGRICFGQRASCCWTGGCGEQEARR